MTYNASELINLNRYPIGERGAKRDSLLNKTRMALAHDGCAVLTGFLSELGIEALRAEADSVSDKGHR